MDTTSTLSWIWALQIVDGLRYRGDGAIEASFDLLCDMFLGVRNDHERERILNSAKRLAENNLFVWKRVGPSVQGILVERIAGLPAKKRESARAVLVEILGEVLKPDVRGTTASYSSFTLHFGTVPASEALIAIRRDAIAQLEDLFRSAKNDDQRLVVLRTLGNATRSPQDGSSSPERLKMVLGDALSVVQFFTAIAEEVSFEILEAMEHDVFSGSTGTIRSSRSDPDADQSGPPPTPPC